jgi:regulator of protease activity HflC (stomatin/prohibitin superfamily)
MNHKPIFTFVIVLFVLVVLYIFFAGYYTIDEGERGVLLRNGAIVGISEPGFGLKIPFVDSIAKVSTQTHTIMYDKLQAYSRDQQPATISASVTYRIPPTEKEVKELYSSFGNTSNIESRLIDRHVPEQIENVFGQYTAISAVQDRVKFGQDAFAAVKKAITGPLIIESVQIENIDFSDAYEKSVEDRMKAEVEVQTQKQNLEKERVSADILVTQAKSRAESQLAMAAAEAQSIRLKGEAEADAIKARATALAQNQNLVELIKAERWNGQLPTTVIPGNVTPFLSLPEKK